MGHKANVFIFIRLLFSIFQPLFAAAAAVTAAAALKTSLLEAVLFFF